MYVGSTPRYRLWLLRAQQLYIHRKDNKCGISWSMFDAGAGIKLELLWDNAFSVVLWCPILSPLGHGLLNRFRSRRGVPLTVVGVINCEGISARTAVCMYFFEYVCMCLFLRAVVPPSLCSRNTTPLRPWQLKGNDISLLFQHRPSTWRTTQHKLLRKACPPASAAETTR